MSKHPRYAVNGSKESSVHVCQLLNGAVQCAEKKQGKSNGDHFTELQCKVIVKIHSKRANMPFKPLS